MITLELWQRLQVVAIYADGVFCIGTLAEAKREQILLNKIVAANPAMFERLCSGRPAIYKTTFVFYAKFGLVPPKIAFGKPSTPQILRSITWGAFIIQTGLRRSLPDQPFLMDEKMLALDPFDRDFPEKINSVVTVFDRSAKALLAGCEPILPRATLSKWVSKMISSLCLQLHAKTATCGEMVLSLDDEIYKVPRERFLSGAFWPSSRGECHADARVYEGIDGPLDGALKWSRDKMVLKAMLGDAEKFAKYKFGVYPA